MLGLNLRSFSSKELWKYPFLLAAASLHICFGRTIESILNLPSPSSLSAKWKFDLALYLFSDCVETFALSWQWLLRSSHSVGTLWSIAASIPKVLQRGASKSVNFGGRYLCSSQSCILAMMRLQAITFPWAGTASPISQSRCVCRVRISLERRELYFYSSRRVGKPLYIDINELNIITNQQQD